MTNRAKNNEGSILLNESENEAIFSSLGKGNQTLCTGVVQLYLAEGSNKQRWAKRCCGVVCFVKDNPKRSYFFRVFDPKSKEMVWEQPVYPRFNYKTPREYFHTFEALDCQAGLNFASEDEAAKFKKVVEGKLLERLQKRDEKKKVHGSTHGVSPSPPSTTNINVPGNNTAGSGTQPSPNVNVHLGQPPTVNTVKETSKKKDSGKGPKKKVLTKKDISTPVDFRHVNHVGWDSNIDIKADPSMKNLFEQVGLHDQADVDDDTMEFIYDFVGKHGGISALKEDLARTKADASSVQQSAAPMETHNDLPPPVPARTLSQQTSHRGPLPPTPPTTTPPTPTTTPPTPTTTPPPSTATPPPPPTRTIPTISSKIPASSPPAAKISPIPPYDNVSPLRPGANIPLSPITNVPPPVAKLTPPPPIVNIPAPPPAPAPPPPPDVPTMTGRTGFLSDIHKGASLKHVDSHQGLASTDLRGGLLSQIRSGTILKPVTQSQTSVPQPTTGIVGALAAALAQRKNVIQGSDDEDASDFIDDDDDDWDD